MTIPLLYWGLDGLNFIQAGKIALLGGLTILAVSSWTTRRGDEGGIGRGLNFLTFFLFLIIIVFQAFLRDLFGVSHDDMIVTEALFSTDGKEAFEFLLQNLFPIIKHLGIMLGVAGSYWLFLTRFPRRVVSLQTAGKSRPWRLAAFSTFLVLVVHLNPTMRLQDPLLYFPLRYMKWERRVETVRKLQEKLNSATSADRALSSMHYKGDGPRTIVFVLGESTTRLDWSMYGYLRHTTPNLDALGNQIFRFRDILAANGSTVLSVEKMMTPATLEQPDLWREKPDILTMAKLAGYKTFWISNHATDASGVLSIFMNHADQVVLTNKGNSRGEGSYDEVTLPPLEAALRDPAPKKLVILHLLGGHPAYYYRYPESFAHFNDADDRVSRGMKAAGRSFWAVKQRDYYDNSMLYADHIIRTTLDLCRGQTGHPIAWIFSPDHGEDVAHYSNFVGHNTRVNSMYEIPLLFWHSENFPLPPVDQKKVESRPYQLDFMDHTLLGLMDIAGDYYDSTQDLFAATFKERLRTVDGKPYRAEAFQGDRIGIRGETPPLPARIVAHHTTKAVF